MMTQILALPLMFSITSRCKGLLRDKLGKTMSAPLDVAVVIRLMYAARFLYQWRTLGDGSASVVG